VRDLIADAPASGARRVDTDDVIASLPGQALGTDV
jgi:hypothetical protein